MNHELKRDECRAGEGAKVGQAESFDFHGWLGTDDEFSSAMLLIAAYALIYWARGLIDTENVTTQVNHLNQLPTQRRQVAKGAKQ